MISLLISLMSDTEYPGGFSNRIGSHSRGSDPPVQSVLVIRQMLDSHHSHNTENMCVWGIQPSISSPLRQNIRSTF